MSRPYRAVVWFTVFTRILYDILGYGVAQPILWVRPRWSSNDEPGRIARLKAWLRNGFKSRLPAYAEYRGGLQYLLKTTRGKARLQHAVEKVPDRVLQVWLQYATGILVIGVIIWSGLLFVGLLVTAVTLLGSIPGIVNTLLSIDLSAFFQSGSTESTTIWPMVMAVVESPDILIDAVLNAVSGLLGFFGLYWLIILLLLPEMVLHEFGHFTAATRADERIEYYGLLMWGPLPMGAFVMPEKDISELDRQARHDILVAGVGNSFLWGVVLLTAGILLTATPIQIVQSLAAHDASILTQNLVGAVLLGVGTIGVLNSFVNSIPIGGTDGGHFIKGIERERYGITEDDNGIEKLRKFTRGQQ